MGVQCLGATPAPARIRGLGSSIRSARDRARCVHRRSRAQPCAPRAALTALTPRAHAHRGLTAATRGRASSHVLTAASGDVPADPQDSSSSSQPEGTAQGGSIDGIADALAMIKRDIGGAGGGSASSQKSQVLLAALVALVSIHVRDPGWGIWNVIRVVGSLILGAGLAFKGYKSGSLDKTGAVGAALVGWGTLYAGVRFGVVLGAFFFLSSAMTKVGSSLKKAIDEHYVPGKESGGRDWIQVAANGLVPTFLAMSYSFATGGPEYLLGVNNAFETPLAAAFIGYYGCCCGDTWSSELGVLSKQMPRRCCGDTWSSARSVVQTDAEADHHRTGSEARDERRGDEPRVSGERGGRVRRGIRVLARRFVRAGGDGKLRLGASVRGAVAGVGDRYRVRVGRFVDGLVARRDGSVQRVLQ